MCQNRSGDRAGKCKKMVLMRPVEWARGECRKPASLRINHTRVPCEPQLQGCYARPAWKRRVWVSLENLAKGCRQWAWLEVRQEFVVGPIYARPNSRSQGHGVKSEVVWGKDISTIQRSYPQSFLHLAPKHAAWSQSPRPSGSGHLSSSLPAGLSY